MIEKQFKTNRQEICSSAYNDLSPKVEILIDRPIYQDAHKKYDEKMYFT